MFCNEYGIPSTGLRIGRIGRNIHRIAFINQCARNPLPVITTNHSRGTACGIKRFSYANERLVRLIVYSFIRRSIPRLPGVALHVIFLTFIPRNLLLFYL